MKAVSSMLFDIDCEPSDGEANQENLKHTHHSACSASVQRLVQDASDSVTQVGERVVLFRPGSAS